MKKLISALLVIMLLVPALALADVDLSGMSYDELVALKDQINKAIWESDTWQEVSVPHGVYTVGEDIPAGKWTIKAADGVRISAKWGDVLDVSGTDVTYEDATINEYESIVSLDYEYYKKDQDKTEVTWELKDGQFVIIDDGAALFTPYAGKQSLGFK